MNKEPNYNPIYLTNERIQLPMDALISDVRNRICQLRGELHDVMRANPGWSERIEPAAGALTCVLQVLYSGTEEYCKVHRKPMPL